MALNPDAQGYTTQPLIHDYDWKDTVLYALGCGARRDAELDYLYEKRGPRVLPTYAVIPSFEVNREIFDVVQGNMLGVVHGAQRITCHKAFASKGRLTTVGKVAGLYDLKRMATSVITTQTKDEAGELVCETEWQIIYRLDGGFGGAPPPKTPRTRPPEREPDFVVEETTTTEQALLYRLNGDLNPLHADPEVGEKAGFGDPILHGLCTYGFVGRAVLHACCDGDPARFKTLAGQFRNPVWPGETLRTEGWNEEGRVVLRAATTQRPTDYVFSNAYAEVAQ